jgi:hypothetical protein
VKNTAKGSRAITRAIIEDDNDALRELADTTLFMGFRDIHERDQFETWWLIEGERIWRAWMLMEKGHAT